MHAIRRLLVTFLLCFGWCGVMPIVILAAYYAARSDATFDPALTLLLKNGQPRPTWLIRIGGTSQTISAGVYINRHFGLNTDAPGQDLVVNHLALDNRTASYLAKLRDQRLPIMLTAYRTTMLNGQLSYDLERNGLAPILTYLRFVALASLLMTLVFEFGRLAKHRKHSVPAEGT